MEYQKARPYLLTALLCLAFLIYQAWQQDFSSVAPASSKSQVNGKSSKSSSTASGASTDSDISDVAQIAANTPSSKASTNVSVNNDQAVETIPDSRIVKVETANYDIQIDLLGGDIVQLDLPKYPKSIDDSTGFELFDHKEELYHIAQSGIYGKDGPDKTSGKALYSVTNKTFSATDKDLIVDLKHKTQKGVDITKRFTFKKDSYVIDVDYIIKNNSRSEYQGQFYGRLKNKLNNGKNGFVGMNTFKGLALNTPDKAIKKISYKDAKKGGFSAQNTGGWAAIVDLYFLSAWVPEQGIDYTYSTKYKDGLYSVTFVNVNPFNVLPGNTTKIGAKLYAGPEIAENLEPLAHGLEKTVDYGIFWPICKPIFWLLSKLHDFLGNWGWAIIFTTIVIKGLFFKLSASSYRSMGRMKKVQPKIQSLKERCGDDKQRFGKEMMELYKKEKINPLGGCLPILVQIPVFIALYYVLLNAVELRQAPFAFWLQDLSVKDPFYILPLIMGASMLLQQKLNPPPPDPVQAKVMMAMPFVFTVLFLQFPSGLVLYWCVNNCLSITQQWVITRGMEDNKPKQAANS